MLPPGVAPGNSRVTRLFFAPGCTHFFSFSRFSVKVSYGSFARLCGRGRMKNPDFQFKLARLASVALFAFSGAVLAQPTEKAANKPRPRPQVIYHLPPSANYAATLHSQAKGQNNDLPVDDRMPTSLKMALDNANAAAAQAPQEVPAPSPQEYRIKRPKSPSNRSVRAQSVKKKEHETPRSNNLHKK
jgi:hypothetical protein